MLGVMAAMNAWGLQLVNRMQNDIAELRQQFVTYVMNNGGSHGPKENERERIRVERIRYGDEDHETEQHDERPARPMGRR